ncbi:pyrroloquinoline quinone biosynthesis protein PqqF [Stutzerimonas kunmingensis]|uniref:pyrroloquinoline quinone biosynthesis protein PqqF n=1 Tax=Stutzerimonas kunmingensis TaxID=1211807 RepID=UPI0028A24D1D|nr:pyrroloquinoline quinone biosynthesis protein PqqF [Stutzerimonas kunmingensis]
MTPDSVPPAVLPQLHVLPNGLRLGFIQLPAGSQAAALVRVNAGAHDAPGEYPGLAHFLEHLLFLGSQAYAPTQSLMPFVQGCAGQLNASTRERHTDFFFQVPAAAFGEALKRLLDMLARPLLDPAAQLREREVLQAEFLARGRDRETLCDAAIGTALSCAHPFSGFHAGNRQTLPVEAPAFQKALTGYHQRFYQTGQMELLVAAPCSLEQVLELLQSDECQLPVAPNVARPIQPLRADDGGTLRLSVDGARPYLNIAFALDGLPDEACVALDVLGSWLSSQADRSLFQALSDAHWCDAVSLRVPYWHDGQCVAVFEVQLTERGMAERAQIVAAVRDWLHFMSTQAGWSEVWGEYAQVRQRGLMGKEPLALLRYWIDPAAWTPSIDTNRVQQALEMLGAQLHASRPIVLTVDGEGCARTKRIEPVKAGFELDLVAEQLPPSDRTVWQWRLPERNLWLSERMQPGVAALQIPSLRWVEHADAAGQGVLYLRWRFAAGQPPAGLWDTLHAALRRHAIAAAQAGVELHFDDHGHSWCLRLCGYAEALPVILRDLTDILKAPSPAAFNEGHRLRYESVTSGADEILIRQLLRRLPLLLAGAARDGDASLDQHALDQAWHQSHWDTLAVGLLRHLSGPLQTVLAELPGLAGPGAGQYDESTPRYCWSRFGQPGVETALVLFCPLPLRTVFIEANWRRLARLMEGAFFRRLRSELQLGYAVFCGYRQFGECPGIVFAVQSPSASASEILAHIETFLDGFAGTLVEVAAADPSTGNHDGDLRRRAESLWQAHLAGFDGDHPEAVAAASANLDARAIRAQLQALRDAEGGWHVVANAEAPDTRWHRC